MFKRILIGIIISITIFNTAAFAYDDVAPDSPYFYGIEYLRRNDVVAETSNFRPDILISKAEFIKYLVKLNNPDFRVGAGVTLPYEDTMDNAWYAPYLYEAIKLGILNGTEQVIYPYNKLTVVEAIELLFHSQSIPIPRRHVGPIPYTDVERNTRYQAMVMRAIELGVAKPERTDYFGLYKRVNRELAAHMIYKMDLVNLRESNAASGIQGLDYELQKIVNVWELINGNFVDRDKVDKQELSDEAIKKMVELLEDPYSAFMNEEENSAFSDDLDGQIEGIGAFVAIDEETGLITIVSPIKDSPAFHAGVKAGDVIIKVDDFETEGASLYETVNRIKGPKGTKVKLTLKRNGGTVIIEVTRDVIEISALDYEVVNGNIMHIMLHSFNQNAVNDFREVSEIISNNSDLKGVIVDVRNNPGGLLDASLGILSYMLPNRKPAVHIKYNYFNYSQYTVGPGTLADYPMVVLINKGSASASEIVAGAMQDHEAAIIIGETSFGKGTVQELNYFGDNSSLKLTVAKWMTPLLHSINKNGIKPDIEVINLSSGTGDKQLDRAISELSKKF